MAVSLSDVVSVLSVIVALVAVFYAWRVDRRSLKLRQEVHDVHWVLQGRGNSGFAWYLVNYGFDSAHDVKYRFAVSGGLQDELIERRYGDVAAGGEVLLNVKEAAKEIGMKPPVAGVIFWRTELGEPRKQFINTDGSDMYATV